MVAKLVQAHGAFQRRPSDFESLHGGVDEGGEGIDDLRVESAVAPVAAADGEGEVEPPSYPTLRALARVDGEEAQHEEHDHEDHEDDGHGLVELESGELVCWWWGQHVW